MVDGSGSSLPCAMPRIVLAQDLAGPGLRQRGHHVHQPEAGHRADLSRAPPPPVRRPDRRRDAPAFSTLKPRGTCPLISSATRSPRTRHRGMGRQHRLDGSGRKPMSRNVDRVVDAAHHEQIAVGVDVPAVAGEVVTGCCTGTTPRTGVVAPQRRERPGGSGRLMQIAPSPPGAHFAPSTQDPVRRSPASARWVSQP